MKYGYEKLMIALIMLLFVVVVIDISVRLNANDRPCLAIPTRFILEEPLCAEKLVRAANVSGVRIVSVTSLDTVVINGN